MKRIIAVVFLLALGGLLFSFTAPVDRYFEIAKNLDIFASLFKEVNALYVDEVNPNKMMRDGIDAMLNNLDPYTNFISEDEVEDFRTLNTGQYGGIGAVTREIDNRTVITMVYEAYPAYKNGLRIGDEVVKMDGVELNKLSREEAEHLMRGQVGTPVKLAIKRFGVDKLIELEFKREKIKVSNVPYFGMMANQIGYVQLTEFTPDAGKEVKNAVFSLKEQGAKGIIIDLRGNPGGLLFEAVNICNIFIPKGKKVVSTKGKVEDSNINYETLNNPLDTEIPVTVIINHHSASASEIVAGTLQDYDRAVIVGEKSYGKGLVQLNRSLSYNSQVKITTAKYYTPTGRCIQVLDYANRREDGSVGSVPDSLKKEFSTTHGRKVFDGGGIEPDVILPSTESSLLTQTLYLNGFLFDYATLYASRHASIPPAKIFSLTDQEYQDFVMWMKDKKYDYKSPLETEMTSFIEEAKKEKYYSELKPQIDQINNRIAESRKMDLLYNKDQIKLFLEEEICSRYYLERGFIEARFKYDKEVKRATEVLLNSSEYKKLLHL